VERIESLPELDAYRPVLARVRVGNLHDRVAGYWRLSNEELANLVEAIP
jgi:hypothetical protein